MAFKVSEFDLEALKLQLEAITGFKYKLDKNGLGYTLYKVNNVFGGVEEMYFGRNSKRELYGKLISFIRGLTYLEETNVK